MSKAVLISIKPQWCALIANGEKTIEVRKTRPKLDPPLKFYIYCSQGSFDLFNNKNAFLGTEDYIQTGFKCNGKVIGEFICKKIDKLIHTGWDRNNQHLEIFNPENNRYEFIDGKWLAKTMLTYQEVDDYSKGGDIYGHHISDLVIYDKPKELSEFYKSGFLSFDDWYNKLCIDDERALLDYEIYENNFRLNRPPQSWCYVEELK